MKSWITGAALALVLVGTQTEVNAQPQPPQCNTRDSIIEQLGTKYSEKRVALGVTASGGLIEVLASRDGKTWTMIITSPSGMSCLIQAGEGWRNFEFPGTKYGDPT